MMFKERIFCCPYCGELSFNVVACEECAVELKNLINFKNMKTKNCDEFTAPFVYDSLVRDAILKFKFGKKIENSESFAFFMKGCNFLHKPDMVVAVPCFNDRKKFRVVKSLTLAFCRFARLKHSFVALEKIKPTKMQHECDLFQRLRNLDGAFVADSYLVDGKSVLICDDIVTSAATIEELAKTLKKAGAVRVGAIAIAVSKIVLEGGLAEILS